MSVGVYSAVERAICEATNTNAKIANRSATSGGCINQSELILMDDGQRYFVKTNHNCPSDMFQREADGLRLIAGTGAIRVPQVVTLGGISGSIFLVLELIESRGKSRSFSKDFGGRLAKMHREGSCHSDGRFGLEYDNYLGSTLQPNSKVESWVEFWVLNRLGFQFGLVRANGYADRNFSNLADRLINKMHSILTIDEPPALIHGDLWSGNYMIGPDSQAVLIDPAVYFAHREAEFGMTTLFGGFDDRFYDSYNANWPLSEGADERIAIYRLYHLLNHVNLFGASYLSGCLEIMNRFA